MLLQTNSYVVPKERRAEHARLLNRFRQTLTRLGCDSFEVFEQAGANWGSGEPSGRYVQLIRFRDRKHHQQVQATERGDAAAQKLIAEFCELINFPYQQQQGLFAVGFYNSVLPVAPARRTMAAHAAVESSPDAIEDVSRDAADSHGVVDVPPADTADANGHAPNESGNDFVEHEMPAHESADAIADAGDEILDAEFLEKADNDRRVEVSSNGGRGESNADAEVTRENGDVRR